MFVIPLLSLFFCQLSLELMHRHIYAGVNIAAGGCDDEDVAVFASCNYLDAYVPAPAAVNNNLHLIDNAEELRQLGSLIAGMGPDCLGYVQMLACDVKKQNESP